MRSNPRRAALQLRDAVSRRAEEPKPFPARDAMSAVDSPLQDADDARDRFVGAAPLAA